MKNHHQFTRVFDIPGYQQHRYPQDKAINIFTDGHWQGTSIARFRELADRVSCWLLSNRLNRGDMVAIMPHQGHLDWLVIDFACQQLGIIMVPLHPTLTREELQLILSETKPKLLVVADNALLKRVVNYLDKNDPLPVLCLDKNSSRSFQPAYVHQCTTEEEQTLDQCKAAIKPDDIFTIMYTSGTAGDPKGTILTHRNMVSNILFTLAAFPLQASRKVMSYLPFSHILERSACYAYLACGANIYFVRSRETFLADFQSARPYFSTSVPKVLEKMYDYLQEQTMAQSWLRRTITKWAIKTAQQYNKRPRNSPGLWLKIVVARLLVLNKWKNQLGGKLACMVVGAAALRPEIARMFSAAKIRIREGYGMTETSPLISLNRFSPGLNRFGTVGIPIPAIDLKINDEDGDGEGEIWVKGPNVTQGYYQRPELNQQVFTADGWFKTGDVGRMVEGRFLQITDRKKDIFKTSAGKYIAPQPLENKLKTSAFIAQSLVIGFARPYVMALIVPNFAILEEWCHRHDIHWTAPQYMVHNIKVIEKYRQEVAGINRDLANFKQIKDFILCEEEWTTANHLLTNTLKPIRKALLSRYDKEINKLYDGK